LPVQGFSSNVRRSLRLEPEKIRAIVRGTTNQARLVRRAKLIGRSSIRRKQ